MTQLCRQRILVRSCSDFKGLDERYLRLAVRSAADNRHLLEALAGLFG
jgi:threonine-phosphate decarboxylase